MPGADLESPQCESTPLMTQSVSSYQQENGSFSTASSSPPEFRSVPSASPAESVESPWGAEEEEEEFTANWADRFLPSIHDRPFTYKLTSNLSAGLTVALINVPLSLSLAVASATTPQVGMITAIWGSLVAAIFGGSQYNIQGPTGALSGILARYAVLWGPQCLPMLSVSSGLFMFLVFLFNWDRYVTFLPSSVAHGFTLGVAAIIAGGQIGAAFSLPAIPPSPHFLINMQKYMVELAAGGADFRAFALFFCVWITLFSCVRRWPRVPWMVPVAFVGVIIGWLSTNEYIFRVSTLQDKYGALSLVLFDPPAVEMTVLTDWSDLLTASLSIAFVGVLESLISGKIADGMTHTSMNQRQEVFAVAAANIACGAAGGLPATAALARTALNIRSGAASRLAGIFNSIFTLLIGLCLLPAFGYLPLCVVASLLFQVAVGMIETKHLVHSFVIDRGAFWLTLVVGAACLIFDPTAAIVLGAIAGLLRSAENVSTGYSEVTLTRDLTSGTKLDLAQFDAHHHAQAKEGMVIAAWRRLCGHGPNDDGHGDAALPRPPSTLSLPESDHTVIYRIVGDLTYISSMHHMSRLRQMDSSRHLVLNMRYCFAADLDGLDALEECLLELRAHRPSRIILLAAIARESMLYPLLRRCDWFERDFRSCGLVMDTVGEARDFLKKKEAADAAQTQTTAQINSDEQIRMSGQRRLSMDDDIA